jgi:DNA polymerase III delta prime subunit
MQLDTITGNERPRAFLAHAVKEDVPSHAYLFTGPAGVGKTATALAFAADLLAAAGAPVGESLHPDLWVEDSDAEQVSIETIRRDGRTGRSASEIAEVEGAPVQALQAFLSLKGMLSDRRVAVLARAERLRETAAAPLLKTIEEPPPGAVLILCTEAAELLPSTIRSRCQEVEFQRLPDAAVAAFLAERGLELEPALLHLAGGCPGRAVRLAEDPEDAARRLEWVQALDGLLGGSWLDIVSLGARFGTPDTGRNRMYAREALDAWETQVRDMAFSQAGAPELTGGRAADWPDVTLPGLLEIWASLREAADRVENNVNPRLAIEIFLADVRRSPVA